MSRRFGGLLLPSVIALGCALAAVEASAGTRLYVLAIGNNAPVAVPGDDASTMHPLRYADDDAAAIWTFFQPLTTHAALLTVLDEDSQRRFPDLAALSRAPTLTELRREIAFLKRQFEADRKSGLEPVLLFFYSGHGSRPASGPPALALLDGALTQSILYEEILAALPAQYVHLLVDACHAEAVVRPRDGHAEVVDLTDDDLHAYAAQTTLERFPHVGAIVAATSTAQTHEWDVYRQGVFSHELLSALRGAADVNHDGRIEYSEVYAFLSSANREVADERARLAVVARPPAINRRIPLVDLHDFGDAGRLVGAGSALGWFMVEDSRGNRLAEVRAEMGHEVALTLPANEELFVRNHNHEATVRLTPHASLDAATLTLRPLSTATRGALDSALRRGLFASPFGPEYYRGFMDGRREFSSVPTTLEARPPSPAPDHIALASPSTALHRAAWASFGVAGGLAIASVVTGALATHSLSEFDNASTQLAASNARNQFNAFVPSALVTGVLGAVAVIAGTALWLRANRRPRATPLIKLDANGAALGLTAPF